MRKVPGLFTKQKKTMMQIIVPKVSKEIFSDFGRVSHNHLFLHSYTVGGERCHCIHMLSLKDQKVRRLEVPQSQSSSDYFAISVRYFRSIGRVVAGMGNSSSEILLISWKTDSGHIMREHVSNFEFPDYCQLAVSFFMVRGRVLCLTSDCTNRYGLFQYTAQSFIQLKDCSLSQGATFTSQALHRSEAPLYASKPVSPRLGSQNMYQIYRLQLKF